MRVEIRPAFDLRGRRRRTVCFWRQGNSGRTFRCPRRGPMALGLAADGVEFRPRRSAACAKRNSPSRGCGPLRGVADILAEIRQDIRDFLPMTRFAGGAGTTGMWPWLSSRRTRVLPGYLSSVSGCFASTIVVLAASFCFGVGPRRQRSWCRARYRNDRWRLEPTLVAAPHHARSRSFFHQRSDACHHLRRDPRRGVMAHSTTRRA